MNPHGYSSDLVRCASSAISVASPSLCAAEASNTRTVCAALCSKFGFFVSRRGHLCACRICLPSNVTPCRIDRRCNTGLQGLCCRERSRLRFFCLSFSEATSVSAAPSISVRTSNAAALNAAQPAGNVLRFGWHVRRKLRRFDTWDGERWACRRGCSGTHLHTTTGNGLAFQNRRVFTPSSATTGSVSSISGVSSSSGTSTSSLSAALVPMHHQRLEAPPPRLCPASRVVRAPHPLVPYREP